MIFYRNVLFNQRGLPSLQLHVTNIGDFFFFIPVLYYGGGRGELERFLRKTDQVLTVLSVKVSGKTTECNKYEDIAERLTSTSGKQQEAPPRN